MDRYRAGGRESVANEYECGGKREELNKAAKEDKNKTIETHTEQLLGPVYYFYFFLTVFRTIWIYYNMLSSVHYVVCVCALRASECLSLSTSISTYYL